MSHEHEEIICPNCGFPATHNYCAQCGQETHLHKETFWGLVMHFIGHYFHYDSKFWQTMKALWFSPGKLTIAYWNKQRMRYIAPVSLYIFISAVYFLISFSIPGESIQINSDRPKTKGLEFTANTHHGGLTFTEDTSSSVVQPNSKSKQATDTTALTRWLNKRLEILKKKHEHPAEFISETAKHSFPKIFFFMIPLMAVFLKILYARRKDLFFVDHAIFALHLHSFWFSLVMFAFLFELTPTSWSEQIEGLAIAILIITGIIYVIAAIRNAYGSKIIKSFFYTLLITIGYLISFFILFLLDLAIIFTLM